MKKNKIFSCLTVALATVSLFFASCDDDVSGIGGSISSSEVNIHIDSLAYDLKATTINAPAPVSRSNFTLLGSIMVPEYGSLDCSYVAQFLPAEVLNLPDTIRYPDIDSVKMILTVPKTYISGDTLAPLQFKAYSLTRQLPQDISSDFNPEGYYDPSSPLAIKNYNLSGYSFNDSTYSNSTKVSVKAMLPVEFGRNIVRMYEEDPEVFVWPDRFAQYWPGIFVKQSFGKGCIAPVQNTGIYAYYPKTVLSSEKDENGETQLVYTQVADSVCLLTTAPEVLSNINISYIPSDNLKEQVKNGKSIITTPGGYTVQFTFPAKEILNEYWKDEYNLGVINNMLFSIPAKAVTNSFGLGIAPALLMVKSSEVDSFFSEGKLPDNKSSFTSLYSSSDKAYTFSSMRDYIVSLKEKGEENITEEDVSFTLVPVTISTEDYTDTSTGNTVTVVTSILPYTIMPTMAELDTQNAIVVFTYSNQILY